MVDRQQVQIGPRPMMRPDKDLLIASFLHVPDADTARMMFEKGETMFTPAAKDVDRFLEEAKQGKWGAQGRQQRLYSTNVNHRHPVLADTRVRVVAGSGNRLRSAD